MSGGNCEEGGRVGWKDSESLRVRDGVLRESQRVKMGVGENTERKDGVTVREKEGVESVWVRMGSCSQIIAYIQTFLGSQSLQNITTSSRRTC